MAGWSRSGNSPPRTLQASIYGVTPSSTKAANEALLESRVLYGQMGPFVFIALVVGYLHDFGLYLRRRRQRRREAGFFGKFAALLRSARCGANPGAEKAPTMPDPPNPTGQWKRTGPKPNVEKAK